MTCMFHIYFLPTLYGFRIRTVLQSLRTVGVLEAIAFVQYSTQSLKRNDTYLL